MKSLEINTQRIEILDVLRGIALCMIIFMNFEGVLLRYFNEYTDDLKMWMKIFLDKKGYPIFSFLFGYGAYIFMNNIHKKGFHPTLTFLRRIGFMFLIGLFHFYFHPGEALTLYAVFGLLLIPIYYLKNQYVFAVGTIIFLLGTYDFGQYLLSLTMMIFGFGFSKMMFFNKFYNKRYLKYYFIFFILTAIISIVGEIYLYKKYMLVPQDFLPNSIAVIGFFQSWAYICLIIILILYFDSIKKIFSIFSYMGRMAFTNYLMQTFLLLIANIWLKDFSYLQGVYLCLGIIIVQLIYSKWYLTKIDTIGPFEKVWRKATYYKLKKANL